VTPTPPESQFLDLTVGPAQVRAHYHDLGPRDGAPVLFCHTGGAAVSAWMCWYRNVEAFATAGYRVIAPDSVNAGKTDVLAGGPVRNTDFLLALLDALGVERAHLIGNSGGGMAILALAAEHPDRAMSLVLSGGEPRAATPDALAIAPRLGRTPRMDHVRAMLGRPRVLLADMRKATAAFFCNPRHPEIETVTRMRLETLRQPGLRERELAGALAQIQGGRQITGEGVFLAVEAPTLLLHGASEPAFYDADDEAPLLAAAMAVVQLIPTCHLQLVANAGHWPQIEQAERYNKAVLGFLPYSTKGPLW